MSQDPNSLLRKAAKHEVDASKWYTVDKQKELQEAADAYIQAANAFRFANQDIDAGNAFRKAAIIQTNKLKEPDDAANTYQEAFKVYRKDSPKDAVECLEIAIDHYGRVRGNLRRAATQKQILAEVYETQHIEGMDFDVQQTMAIAAYTDAAKMFEKDSAQALANKLYLKVGDLVAMKAVDLAATKAGDEKAMHELYNEAIENYEKVAASSVSNNLMKWSVKDYFLKAGLCHLANGDMVTTNRAFEKYRGMDPTFASTREHQLLIDLAEAIAAGDSDEFAQKLFLYDQMSKLDKWKTDVLLRIKESIVETGDDFS